MSKMIAACDYPSQIEKQMLANKTDKTKDGKFISRDSFSIDAVKMIKLLEALKSMQQTSGLIMALSQSDSDRMKKLTDNLQIILENQATNSNPLNIFSTLSSDNAIVKTLFPLAIESTTAMLNMFDFAKNQVDSASMPFASSTTPLVELKLCMYPKILHLIIKSLAGMLAIYSLIAFTYCTHNTKLRQYLYVHSKVISNIDSLTKMTVFIDKRFQTSFVSTNSKARLSQNNFHKLMPLVNFYANLTKYLCNNLGSQTQENKITNIFAVMSNQLESIANRSMVNTTLTKANLQASDLQTLPSDPKMVAADDFIANTLDQAVYKQITPNSIENLLGFIPKSSASSCLVMGDNNFDAAVANDLYSDIFQFAGAHPDSFEHLPNDDLFERLVYDDSFMCSTAGSGGNNKRRRFSTTSSILPKSNKKRKTTTDPIICTKNQWESGNGSDNDDFDLVRGKEFSINDLQNGGVNERENVVFDKNNDVDDDDVDDVENDEYVNVDVDVNVDENDDDDDDDDNDDNETISGIGSTNEITELLNTLSKDMAENLTEIHEKLGHIPTNRATEKVKEMYKKLNSVVDIILESLDLAQTSFNLDAVQIQLKDELLSSNSAIDNLLQEEVVGDDKKLTITEQMSRVAVIWASKIQLVHTIQTAIIKTIERIKHEISVFSKIQAEAETHTILMDSNVRHIYETMVGDTNSFIQLAIPVEFISIIHELNCNSPTAKLYTQIVDTLFENKLMVQINTLNLVPVEYYLLDNQNTSYNFFNNKDMRTKYKINYARAILKMFSYANIFSDWVYRQYIDEKEHLNLMPPGLSGPPTTSGTTSTTDTSNVMIIKSKLPSNAPDPRSNMGKSTAAAASSTSTASTTTAAAAASSSVTTADVKTFGNQKFEFMRGVQANRELTSNMDNYVRCISCFSLGASTSLSTSFVSNNGGTSGFGSTATMFLLTNFIYNLDVYMILNLLAIQLNIINDQETIDRVHTIILGYLNTMVKTNLQNTTATDNVPLMFVAPIARTICLLTLLNPLNTPNVTEPVSAQQIKDDKFKQILVDMLTSKPMLIKELSDTYNINISRDAGQIRIQFQKVANKIEADIKASQFRIKDDLYKDLWASKEPIPNLLSYVEPLGGNTNSGSGTFGKIIDSIKIDQFQIEKDKPLISYLLPKLAFINNCTNLMLIRTTKISPIVDHTFNILPIEFKAASNSVDFKLV